MSDITPSYRLRPERDGGGSSWRMLAIGGGLLAALGLGALAIWGMTRDGSGSVPLIEADPRPVRVRPTDPGGLRVQNQDELIFDRDRRPTNTGARLAPEAEGPRLDALRQQVAPPPAPTPAPSTPPAAAAPSTPATPAAARTPPPATTGRIQVQIGALPTEEAARTEWDRLARRAPELLGDRRPAVTRFEREGQPALFRLRTGLFADAEAARTFCESLRAKGGNCTVIRP
ncbi:SPOR domain-containing protein [Plastoroseomonas arctica]|uniref:SPOR domain-containing protein n=1 Tax=Plastoroseomonas arctica TaxID=1509237 RepID=A0AAF1JWU5_9PROT|nr:SPOR domain-containing protein [Plastoroseomonas arctica]